MGGDCTSSGYAARVVATSFGGYQWVMALDWLPLGQLAVSGAQEPYAAQSLSTRRAFDEEQQAMQIRRAFLITSVERYVVVLINLIILIALSRLMTPSDIGTAMIGASVLAMAQSLRDFGTSGYLLQQTVVTDSALRTAFTLTLLIALVLAAALLGIHRRLADFYGNAQLGPVLQVMAVGLIVGTFAGPGWSLLQRDLAFTPLAGINIASYVLYGLLAIGMAALGCGALSIAGALAAQSAFIAIVVMIVKPLPRAFLPSLRDWRSVVSFGSATSATFVINRAYESLPYLALGRILSVEGVGLFSRATMICDLPQKGLLSGVAPLALPALAKTTRDGHSLGDAYVRAISYITVVHWPASALIAILAHPIIAITLGATWIAAVPLVQIMALAATLAASASLTYPVLAAAGAVNQALVVSVLTQPLCAVIFVLAAQLGITAAALSLFVTGAIQSVAALWFVQKRAHFSWSDLGRALRKSLAVTLSSAIVPMVILALAGFRSDISLLAALVAVVGGVMGWVAGIVWVNHPLLAQLQQAAQFAQRRLKAWQQSALAVRANQRPSS